MVIFSFFDLRKKDVRNVEFRIFLKELKFLLKLEFEFWHWFVLAVWAELWDIKFFRDLVGTHFSVSSPPMCWS